MALSFLSLPGFRSFFFLFVTSPKPWLSVWLLMVAVLSIFNSIQNYMSTSLSKRLFNGHPNQLTPLAARLFATWTLLASVIRVYAAFHLRSHEIVIITLSTFYIVFLFFISVRSRPDSFCLQSVKYPYNLFKIPF